VLGRLQTSPAREHPELLAPPVAAALAGAWGADVLVAEIDPALADTAAFCERYDVALDVSANCVVVAGRRGSETRLAACVVLATTRADVNGVVRRRLDARKASFAPMDMAVEQTGMEHGGITPFGLPPGWPLLVDAAVTATPWVIVGSGLRRSKLAVPGRVLGTLPGAEVVEGLATPAPLSAG
jgi:prolyl-tRNA editing enzyme YbaK/EbsC (Cys-tRNA(Pro) deacylase)